MENYLRYPTMKDFEYYSNNPLPYPKKTDFIHVYGYKGGKCLFSMSLNEYDTQKQNMKLPVATVEREFDDKAYSVAQKVRRARENRLQQEFKADLYEEYGVEDNPKADKAYAIAYERGHSGGYQEVAGWFDELVDLIR